jgi:hypothetical protein
MNKKLLLTSCFLLCSSLIAEESSDNIIQTNVPNVYVKNIMCDPQNDYRLTFNVVNKSDKKVYSYTMVVYDLSGDPIDNQVAKLKTSILPDSGLSSSFYMKNCKVREKSLRLRFSVTTD